MTTQSDLASLQTSLGVLLSAVGTIESAITSANEHNDAIVTAAVDAGNAVIADNSAALSFDVGNLEVAATQIENQAAALNTIANQILADISVPTGPTGASGPTGTHTGPTGASGPTGVSTGPSGPTGPTGITPSTKPPAGLYVGGLSQAESLASTLGISPLEGFTTYCTGTTWPSIGSYTPPTLPKGCWLLLGVNLCPDTAPTGVSTVEANLGTFTKLANNLKTATSAGVTVVCRVGWEFDGNWFQWGNGKNGNTPSTIQAAMRAVILAMKAANPALKFDFSCNVGTSKTTAQLLSFYPGSDVIDYIGGDHYDDKGSTTGGTPSFWTPVIEFAVQEGKPLSCGEWGLNGSDDTKFIISQAQIFLTPAAAAKQYGWPAYTVGYHAYFSANISGGINSDITQFKNSEAQFKVSFG